MEKKIEIYTDGSAAGNPGRGGFGVVMLYGDHRREISKGYTLTTNNRMELMGVIAGLRALKNEGSEVTIFTDSMYIVNAVNKGWLFNWRKDPYFNQRKNYDLWVQFLELWDLHKIKFVWVKGHASNKENNRCDVLAVAAGRTPQYTDVEYIKSLNKE